MVIRGSRQIIQLSGLIFLLLVACQDQLPLGPDPSPESEAASTSPPPTASPSPEIPDQASRTTDLGPVNQNESAANADVLFVAARMVEENNWTFTVTIEHPDSGWEDYADGWDVLLPNGAVLKPDPDSPFTRLLLHPHENEQPFTRSQSNIIIPAGIDQVVVRAHDLVDGFGGQEIKVDITAEAGPGFEIQR